MIKCYGGLSFRFAPREETPITPSRGLETGDSNLLQFSWADESGKLSGRDAFTGVAIFQHAGNPDFPAGWCLRHYGFLGVNWPGLEPVTLQPNRPVTLRFRIWVHNGAVTLGKVEDAFAVFSKPPKLRVVE